MASGLRISAPMLNAVVAHLAAARPNEGVGLIAVRPDGDFDRAIAFYPGTNLDQSPTRYTMDPTEVLAALGEMGARGWSLGAIVHSHVQSAPTPSATDVREAYYPVALMLIVGFTGGEAVAKLWRVPQSESEAGMREAQLVVDNDDFCTTAGLVVGERLDGSGKGGRDSDCK